MAIKTGLMHGPLLATLSAVLFGISPALCKLVIGEMSPILLAGLLYLGSGIGLSFVLVRQRINIIRETRGISRLHRLKLLCAVLAGGVIAPLCLVYGIKHGKASEVALLLNLETVATTIIAWRIFKEQVSRNVWAGKVLIVLAASVIILKSPEGLAFSASGILVVLACIFWGIDNNLTRDVDELPATALAAIKGYGAGLFNIILAAVLGFGTFEAYQIGGALLIGALSYGTSLVFFIGALRKIGSARSSTFFAIGPFIGVLTSLILLHEQPPAFFWLAAALMLAGVLCLYRERHEHPHAHGALTHRHQHTHDQDEHHRHLHDEKDNSEPHDHYHVHERLTHRHVHWPDTHHRHGHC
ncbi:MAG: EamA family transporter [Desulfobacteraceae bacterium]|nr:EamA family transporter [Desulfobacteraceae bacterium]